MQDRPGNECGFTLTELLVSMVVFSIFSMGAVMYLTQNLSRLGTEVRLTMASQEMRNAVNLLSSELRMASTVSPYLPGNTSATVTCGAQLTANSTSVKFLVVHDDASAPSGMKAYYVGYRYDATTGELLRGQLASSSTTSCSLPTGDPAAAGTALKIVENVVQVDNDGNGSLDPVFSYANHRLTMNFGVRVDVKDGSQITEKLSTQIFARTP